MMYSSHTFWVYKFRRKLLFGIFRTCCGTEKKIKNWVIFLQPETPGFNFYSFFEHVSSWFPVLCMPALSRNQTVVKNNSEGLKLLFLTFISWFCMNQLKTITQGCRLRDVTPLWRGVLSLLSAGYVMEMLTQSNFWLTLYDIKKWSWGGL